MSKKVLSIFLVLVMVLSIAPVSVFAEDDILDYLTYEIVDGEVIIIDCDESISGDVVIPDTIEGYPVTALGTDYYHWYTPNDVFANCTEITSIVIPDSVKSTTQGIFSGCTGLKSVTIPDSLSEIAQSMFHSCTSLESITIPDSISVIGSYAFLGCESLKSITIPDSVTSIGSYYVFENCTSLTNIDIGSGLSSIDAYSLMGCTSLVSITVDKDNINLANDEYGVLYRQWNKKLIKFPSASSLTEYTIPDDVEYIEEGAFSDCINLKKVTMPAALKDIGFFQFTDCSALETIVVDDNNSKFSSDEFGVLFNKDKTELIKYPQGNSRPEYTIPDSVTSIAQQAFSGCTNLTNIIIPDSVTDIQEYAFANCENLTNIRIPESVTSINNSVFENCISLTNIVIPDNVTEIDNSAFNGCKNITAFNVSENNLNYSSDADGVVFNKDKTELICFPAGKSNTEYTIPISVTTIVQSAFSGNNNLKSIIIPDNVIMIGRFAFSDCENLSNIEIGNGVVTIEDYAFSGCTSLTKLTIPDSVTIFNENVIEACTNLESLVLGDGIKYICLTDYYLDDCKNLANITLGKSVEDIIFYDFYDGSSYDRIVSITVDDENAKYSNDEFGVLYNKDKTELIQYTTANSRTAYTIPDGVTTINHSAFYRAVNLKSITIPASVTTIYFDANSEYFDFADFDDILLEGVTIYGYEGSAAEAYADKNGITFVAIEPEDDVTIPDEPSTDKPVTDKPTTDEPTTDKPVQDTSTALTPNTDSNITVADTFANLIPEMTVADIVKSVKNQNITVLSADGKKLTANSPVGTGSKVQVVDKNGKVLSEYDVVVKADVTGDATITAEDARLALRASASLDKLEGVYATAANYNGDKDLTAEDARLILRKSAGLE